MHKEIIVNSTPYEVRIAILEDKELVELLIERAETKRMVGDIFKGVVTAVLPGIQAAFVEIGADKAAFLHVSDLLEVREDVEDEPADRRRSGRSNGRAPLPPIQDILQKGQEILVQVTKEPIATKGPRITTQISLPGRFAVIMPNVDHVGVSRKIEDRAERSRLKEIVNQLKPRDCALIVRTVGEGASRTALENDVSHLVANWREIQSKAGPARAPSLVYQDAGLVLGLVRDVFNDEVEQVVLDDRAAHDELLGYLQGVAPELASRVKLHEDPMPIFDKYGIENELDKTLDRKVWLKKGGYILIEQTEALVAIDVNTGRFTGKKNQEETILKTNLLAAREAARQLRLRDIGGIIVIDFIDMESEANKKKVLLDLRTWLKRDRAKTKAFSVSDLGLVEMSRQRVRPSLYHFMSDKCVFCEATGHVLSLDSVANRVERMVRRVSHYTRARDVRLQANPHVAVFLREERYDRLQALMRATGVSIDVVDDARLHREDFRLMSVQTGEDLMKRVSGPGLSGPPDRADESDFRRRPPRGRPERDQAGAEGPREQRDWHRSEGRDTQSPDSRDSRDSRVGRDSRDSRDSRAGRDSRVSRDSRDSRGSRDSRDSRQRREPPEGRGDHRDPREGRGPVEPRAPQVAEAVETSPVQSGQRPQRQIDTRERRRGRGGRGRREGRPLEARRMDSPEAAVPHSVDAATGVDTVRAAPAGEPATEQGTGTGNGAADSLRRKRRRGSRGRGRRGGGGGRPNLEDNPQARVTTFPSEAGSTPSNQTGPSPSAEGA